MGKQILKINQNLLESHKEEYVFLMSQLMEEYSEDCLQYVLSKYKDLYDFLGNGTAIVFASLNNDKPIGYIWAYERKCEDGVRLHITQFVVDANYRKNGIGKKLLDSIEEYSIQCGHKRIELNVASDNYNAQKFYDKYGFSSERMLMTKVL